MSKIYKKDIITTENMSKEFVEFLINEAEHMRQNKNEISELLKGKIIYHLFLEPSTRTSSSFISASYKLGANVILVNNSQYSSMAKGESFEDTLKTIECYSDLLVLRTPVKGMAKVASNLLNIPVINAGDGDGEHPTQALLDIYTIYREKSNIENINIGLVGDLKYSRTIHSLCYFAKIFNFNVFCISPSEIELPEEYEKISNVVAKTNSLKEVIGDLDIIYVTRIQKERMPHLTCDFDIDSYKITPEIMKMAKENCIVMHPFPRNEEIKTLFDEDPRAAYFRQIENGMWMRCAILKYCFS